MDVQLKLQDGVAQLSRRRHEHGALDFVTPEARPSLTATRCVS
jgi:hypothetical protein